MAEQPDPPPDSALPARAEAFRLGPRSTWNPARSTAYLAAATFLPMLALGYLLQPIHPLLGIALGLVITLVAVLRPSIDVIVGEDGLSIGSRFLAWRDVATVSRGEYFGRGIAAIVVLLESGEEIQLWCIVDVGERIRAAALAAKTRFDSSSHDVPRANLERRNRDPIVWVRELRSLSAGANATHRTAPVPRDALWHAALDTAAAPSVRAAAAVALGPLLDTTGRSRLRVAADATASPRLRIAIERVLCDADEPALAAALAEAEAPQSKRLVPG